MASLKSLLIYTSDQEIRVRRWQHGTTWAGASGHPEPQLGERAPPGRVWATETLTALPLRKAQVRGSRLQTPNPPLSGEQSYMLKSIFCLNIALFCVQINGPPGSGLLTVLSHAGCFMQSTALMGCCFSPPVLPLAPM